MSGAPNAAASGLFLLADPAWRSKLARTGWWILLCPVVGWPAALGCRKALARALFEPGRPELPTLEGRVQERFVSGLGAIGVQLAYFAPLYLALGALLVRRGFEPGPGTLAAVLVVLALPYLSPLAFPGALALLHARGGGLLAFGEELAFVAAFAVAVFLLPAGYLQVTRTGRYRDALRLDRSVPFVARHLAAYARAWLVTGAQSVLSVLAGPLAPWGLAWHYAASLFAFNELLHRAEPAPRGAWIARALDGPYATPRPRVGIGRATDAAGEPAAVLDLRLVAAPLPCLRGRRLREPR